MTTQKDSHWFSVGIILAGCVLVVIVLSRPEKPAPRTQQPDPQSWNPVAEMRRRYPDSGLSDQQIFQDLHDPAKFRSALPEYSSTATDVEITSGDFQGRSLCGKSGIFNKGLPWSVASIDGEHCSISERNRTSSCGHIFLTC